MARKNLIIVGDSAFAEIAYEYFNFDSQYEVVAFAVERNYIKKESLFNLPIIPFEDIESFFSPKDHYVFVAVVYTQLNRLRTRLTKSAKEKGYQLASYISSNAFLWKNVSIGEHCFIFENNTIQPFVTLDDNIILWSGNHIGHHSRIRENCFISSHVVISGFCDIGNNSFIGVNATISNNVCVGKDNWIGPNTTIMKNTDDGALYKTTQPAPVKISANVFFKIEE